MGTKAGFSFICTYVKVVSLNNLRNISAHQHDCRSVFHACLRGHWRTLSTRIVFQQIIIMLYCCWQHHINKISNAIKLNGFKHTQYIKKERNLNCIRDPYYFLLLIMSLLHQVLHSVLSLFPCL